MTKQTKDKVRVQFDISRAQQQRLMVLMEAMGLSTRTELFNNALTVLKWAAKQRSLGRIIAAVEQDESGYHELSLPGLDAVAAQPGGLDI